MLVEIPTVDETSDNIVAFWNPAEKPQRGQELLFGYRLYWCRYNPALSKLAQTESRRATASAASSVRSATTSRGGSWSISPAGISRCSGEEAHVEPVISASRGSVEITSARPLHAISGWRAMFDLKPVRRELEPINLRLFLALDGQPLTETWLYQYTPPPLDQRKIL